MARNTNKTDFAFEKGMDLGVVDELQEASPKIVRDLHWVSEGALQTRPPYTFNTETVPSIFTGIRHMVTDGKRAFYQSERGKMTFPDVKPSLTTYEADSPPVDVSVFANDLSDAELLTCQCAVMADYVAVVFEQNPPGAAHRITARIYRRDTGELLQESGQFNAEQPRVAAAGTTDFIFTFHDTLSTAQLKEFSFTIATLAFSGVTTVVTNYNNNDWYALIADSGHFYLGYGNTTPRLTVRKVDKTTKAIALTYTHATLDAINLDMAFHPTSVSMYVTFDDGVAGNVVTVQVSRTTMLQTATINSALGVLTTYERLSIATYTNLSAAVRVVITANSPSSTNRTLLVMEHNATLSSTATTTIQRTLLLSRVFIWKSSEIEIPMAIVADHNAENSLQTHAVLATLPQNGTAVGFSGLVPVSVLTVDEANVPNGSAVNDYPFYTVEQDGTNSGIYYASLMRLTGFDEASGAVASRLWSVRTYKLDLSMAKALPYERFDAQAHTAGGLMLHPTAARPMESAVIGAPYIESVVPSAGGLTGTYQWRAVWEITDENGIKARSFPSPVTAATALTAQQAVLTITVPRFSLYDSSLNFAYSLAIYRTLANGSIFHLVNRIDIEPAGNGVNGVIVHGDNATDANVSVGEVLRHGITGGDLGPIVPPASTFVFTWRDRLCVISAEDGRLWYSMPDVINRGPEFNAVLSWSVPDEPVAGAQLNNNAVVFAENAIYVCSGSLGDAAGRGQSIAVQQISRTVGCTNRNSIITGSRGVYFESKRGLELLTPDYEIVRIRGMEEELLTGRPLRTIHGAAINPNSDEVMFLLATTTHDQPRIYRLNETNLNLSYDVLPSIEADKVYHIAAHQNEVRLLTKTIADAHNFADEDLSTTKGADVRGGGQLAEIQPDYTSPWFQIDGPQGDQELQELILKFRMSAVNGNPRTSITISEWYDHETSSSISVDLNLGTLTTDLDSPGLHQIRHRPSRQRCQAFRFSIDYQNGIGANGNTFLKLIHARLETGVLAGGARVTPTAEV